MLEGLSQRSIESKPATVSISSTTPGVPIEASEIISSPTGGSELPRAMKKSRMSSRRPGPQKVRPMPPPFSRSLFC